MAIEKYTTLDSLKIEKHISWISSQEQLNFLKLGIQNWNKWVEENPMKRGNIVGVNLSGNNLAQINLKEAKAWKANLKNANLSYANLQGADLRGANLQGASLERANLENANLDYSNLKSAWCINSNFKGSSLKQTVLDEANLFKVNLNEVTLENASLCETNLSWARLNNSNLYRARFVGSYLKKTFFNNANLEYATFTLANLKKACFKKSNLESAFFGQANLTETCFYGANLKDAYLTNSSLIKTDFTEAILSGCKIYGISAWDVITDRAIQNGLVVTQKEQPEITVDDLKIAQFIYLLLETSEIRNIINTMTGKCVLLLGRFAEDRKLILDKIADWLRNNDLIPIVMDFEQPENKDFTETVRTLAGLCKYVIVDLTYPQSVPHEIANIVKDLEMPIVPLIETGNYPYSMFKDMSKYHWVLPLIEYKNEKNLVEIMEEKIILPAERKHQEIEERKKVLWQSYIS